MKKFLLLSLLLTLSACASSKADRGPIMITFTRAGGFSGLEDRYTIEENGHISKTMRFPGRPENRVGDTVIAKTEVAPIFAFLDRNLDSIRALSLDTKGNMTTTLMLQWGKEAHTLRWANLEPPILPTNKLDSLYQLVTPVQVWLSASQ